MTAQIAATARLLILGAICLVTGIAVTVQVIKVDEALQIARAVK